MSVDQSDESSESDDTEDIVLAAADLAGQLATDLDIDFDFEGLEDDLEELGLSDPIEEIEAVEAAEIPEDFEGDELVFDFDDLVAGISIGGDEELDIESEPEAAEAEAPVEEPVEAASDDSLFLGDLDMDIDIDSELDADIEAAFAEAEPDPDPEPEAVVKEPAEEQKEELVAMDELAADILDEDGVVTPSRLGFLSKAKIPALASSKAVWVLMGVVFFFNGLTALLGFYALSVFSDGMEGMSTNLADSLHQIRVANTEVRQVPAVAQEGTVPSTPNTVFAGQIGVKTEAPEITELNAARKQLDEGLFHEARRRLFRLLAVSDSPLLEDGKYAEAEASLMIAESYFLEAKAAQEMTQ